MCSRTPYGWRRSSLAPGIWKLDSLLEHLVSLHHILTLLSPRTNLKHRQGLDKLLRSIPNLLRQHPTPHIQRFSNILDWIYPALSHHGGWHTRWDNARSRTPSTSYRTRDAFRSWRPLCDSTVLEVLADFPGARRLCGSGQWPAWLDECCGYSAVLEKEEDDCNGYCGDGK